jgi:outer membrane receptor protein involved in Fe transport
LYQIGNQRAKSVTYTNNLVAVDINSTELKGITDINLGFEYRYNKKLGAFLNLNNLAGTRYYRWNNYPTYRFNFLAGLSYSF